MKRALLLIVTPLLGACSTLTPYVRDVSVVNTSDGPALVTTRCELRQEFAVFSIHVYVEPDKTCVTTTTPIGAGRK